MFLFSRVAKPAVGGLLAAFFLLFGTASVNHSLHKFFHSESAVSHSCVICHFAKGQITAANLAPVAAIFVFYFPGLTFLAKSPALSAVDIRLSPSRAPPVSFHF